MPIIRAIGNRVIDDKAPLHFYGDRVSWKDKTVYYSDVHTVIFLFDHTKHSTNLVTDDDTIEYYITINDIKLHRYDSHFNRVLSSAKAAAKNFENEFQEYVSSIYEYIIPGLFERKVKELLEKDRTDIGEISFRTDGTISLKGVRYNLSDIEIRPTTYYSYEFCDKNTKTAILKNNKRILEANRGYPNYCLIEPMLRLVGSL